MINMKPSQTNNVKVFEKNYDFKTMELRDKLQKYKLHNLSQSIDCSPNNSRLDSRNASPNRSSTITMSYCHAPAINKKSKQILQNSNKFKLQPIKKVKFQFGQEPENIKKLLVI